MIFEVYPNVGSKASSDFECYSMLILRVSRAVILRVILMLILRVSLPAVLQILFNDD